jgi:alpha-D-ribose 1-methylphosphonate 5-triphosphate synthase subunit PhnG
MTETDTNGIAAGRKELMRACAQASLEELRNAVAQIDPKAEFDELRAPETGMVMLRGRIGGDGAPFNFGEATVSRAVVKLGTGEVGYSYVLGRSPEKARLAAIIDALGQRPTGREALESALVAPVGERVAEQARQTRRRTAATKVDFFTLVRGED